jgi:hypothetical protein
MLRFPDYFLKESSEGHESVRGPVLCSFDQLQLEFAPLGGFTGFHNPTEVDRVTITANLPNGPVQFDKRITARVIWNLKIAVFPIRVDVFDELPRHVRQLQREGSTLDPIKRFVEAVAGLSLDTIKRQDAFKVFLKCLKA